MKSTLKNKIAFIFFAFVLSFILVFPGTARAAENSRLIDTAGLLSDSEAEKVLTALNQVSEKYSMDVVVLTVSGLDGKTTEAAADDYYDNNGYAQDGVVLLVSMEERDWYISTKGFGIKAFTDAGIQYIGEQIAGPLGKQKYEKAFTSFAELSDDFIQKAKDGKPYDSNNLPVGKMPWYWILIALGVGFVLALITVGSMKAKLKSVRFQAGASSYVRSGSVNVTKRGDLFLYRTVDRREKPKDNDSGGGSSTHTSSSGSTHGGGGGKF